MITTCQPAPSNKKEYVTDIGRILVEDYGKKKYYSPEEVNKANRKSKWYDNLDFGCWAMSIFSSHSDFDKYHQELGESCDYAAMKTEMVSGLTSTDSSTLFDFSGLELPEIDIEASWLDFGDVFESVFSGIGDVIGGILDGF